MINTEKSSAMKFNCRGVPLYLNLSINNKRLKFYLFIITILNIVNDSWFLGIQLDLALSWKGHIDNVCSKLSKGIFILHSHYNDRNSMRMAYLLLLSLT